MQPDSLFRTAPRALSLGDCLNRFRRSLLVASLVLLCGLPSLHSTGAEILESKGQLPASEETVHAFLEDHCIDCHGEDKAKGDLRLDKLSMDFSNLATAEVWAKVRERLRDGEMPPKKEPRPDASATDALLHWLADHTRAGAKRPAVSRRMNRIEYENTLRDLLDLPWLDVKELLPQDGESAGFDTVGDGLDISYVQMTRYLEAANVALGQAVTAALQPIKPESRIIRDWPQNMPSWWERSKLGAAVPLAETGPDPVWDKSTGKLRADADPKKLRPLKAIGVFFHADPASPLRLNSSKIRVQMPGVYRITLSAYAFDWDKGEVLPAKTARPFELATGTRSLGFFDAPANEPAVVTVTTWLDAEEEINFNPVSLHHGAGLKNGAADITRPGVAIEWTELEGPLIRPWPPVARSLLFGNLPLMEWQEKFSGTTRPPREGRLTFPLYTVAPRDSQADAERLLRDFLPRAFRRPAPESEIQRYLKIAREKLEAGTTFEEAIRTACRAVLCSPDFLFLRTQPGKADAYALAARLSYFIWSTMPDEELRRLAANGALLKPDVLRAQTNRLLDNPRSRQFVENFTGQWLKLRDINATQPDRQLYPEQEWESDVASYMTWSLVEETRQFFQSMLHDDLSVTNLIDSDFAMVNEPLAKLYGLTDVSGSVFRKVALPAGSHRGGILTQASVLKVSANGTTTSPVLRGAWVTTRLLGRPAPPPPPNVPGLDPDVRGATTIREQLAKHRSNEMCAGCHAKIDPPGFALESYDAVGGWRERYRIMENARLNRNGLPVDCAGETVSGQPFQNTSELKKILLQDKDQLVRGLASKLLIYATGSPLSPADRLEVDDIVERLRSQNYGVRSMIHEIVQSQSFRP